MFLDYNMNRRSASLAAVYSPRAIDWAGVSTPLRWDELDAAYPTQFDILNVPDRIARYGDVWQHILDAREPAELRRLASDGVVDGHLDQQRARRLQTDADDGSEQRKHDENAMPPARGSEPSDPADALRLVRLALRELFSPGFIDWIISTGDSHRSRTN